MRSLILLTLLAGAPAFASEDLSEEIRQAQESMEQAQRNASEVLKQIQEKTSGAADGGQFSAVRERVMRLANNPDFLRAATEIATHPKRVTVLLVNLGFFVLMIILKAWRQAKASNWFVKMAVGFCFTILTWFGMIYVIPSFFFGGIYQVFLGAIWKALAG